MRAASAQKGPTCPPTDGRRGFASGPSSGRGRGLQQLPQSRSHDSLQQLAEAAEQGNGRMRPTSPLPGSETRSTQFEDAAERSNSTVSSVSSIAPGLYTTNTWQPQVHEQQAMIDGQIGSTKSPSSSGIQPSPFGQVGAPPPAAVSAPPTVTYETQHGFNAQHAPDLQTQAAVRAASNPHPSLFEAAPAGQQGQSLANGQREAQAAAVNAQQALYEHNGPPAGNSQQGMGMVLSHMPPGAQHPGYEGLGGASAALSPAASQAMYEAAAGANAVQQRLFDAQSVTKSQQLPPPLPHPHAFESSASAPAPPAGPRLFDGTGVAASAAQQNHFDGQILAASGRAASHGAASMQSASSNAQQALYENQVIAAAAADMAAMSSSQGMFDAQGHSDGSHAPSRSRHPPQGFYEPTPTGATSPNLNGGAPPMYSRASAAFDALSAAGSLGGDSQISLQPAYSHHSASTEHQGAYDMHDAQYDPTANASAIFAAASAAYNAQSGGNYETPKLGMGAHGRQAALNDPFGRPAMQLSQPLATAGSHASQQQAAFDAVPTLAQQQFDVAAAQNLAAQQRLEAAAQTLVQQQYDTAAQNMAQQQMGAAGMAAVQQQQNLEAAASSMVQQQLEAAAAASNIAQQQYEAVQTMAAQGITQQQYEAAAQNIAHQFAASQLGFEVPGGMFAAAPSNPGALAGVAPYDTGHARQKALKHSGPGPKGNELADYVPLAQHEKVRRENARLQSEIERLEKEVQRQKALRDTERSEFSESKERLKHSWAADRDDFARVKEQLKKKNADHHVQNGRLSQQLKESEATCRSLRELLMRNNVPLPAELDGTGGTGTGLGNMPPASAALPVQPQPQLTRELSDVSKRFNDEFDADAVREATSSPTPFLEPTQRPPAPDTAAPAEAAKSSPAAAPPPHPVALPAAQPVAPPAAPEVALAPAQMVVPGPAPAALVEAPAVQQAVQAPDAPPVVDSEPAAPAAVVAAPAAGPAPTVAAPPAAAAEPATTENAAATAAVAAATAAAALGQLAAALTSQAGDASASAAAAAAAAAASSGGSDIASPPGALEGSPAPDPAIAVAEAARALAALMVPAKPATAAPSPAVASSSEKAAPLAEVPEPNGLANGTVESNPSGASAAGQAPAA